MTTRWSVLGVCVVIGGGCLSDSGRRVAEDTGAGDTGVGDTGVGDTGAADTGAGDTGGWEADVGHECGDCDDNDPCTYDRCNPDTGLCENLGYPGASEPDANGEAPPDGAGDGAGDQAGDQAIMAPECVGDADCDDHDACTTNICLELANECRPATAICVYEPILGCSAPCDSGGSCDDGNPCTNDVCTAAGTCDHWPEEGCVPQCTRAGLVAIGDLMNAPPPGGLVKTRGVVAPLSYGQSCDDGPDCGCFAQTALWGDGRELPIDPAVDGGGGVPMPPDPNDQAAWQCTTMGCGDLVVECQPVQEGVVYRVWGTALEDSGIVPAGGSGGAIPRVPPVERMAVEGFCLDTEPTSLTGDYAGVIELQPGMQIGFTVSMLAVDQGVLVSIGEARCLTNDCPEWATAGFAQDAVLYEGDGRIGFDFVVPFLGASENAHARLFSNASRFVGRWEPAYAPPGAIAVPVAGGLVELTREGTGAMPVPNEP